MPRKKAESQSPGESPSNIRRKAPTKAVRKSATETTTSASAKPRARRASGKKMSDVAVEELPKNLRGATGDQEKQPITTEQIAERAYFLWLERGCPEGTAEQDWMDAEVQLGVRR